MQDHRLSRHESIQVHDQIRDPNDYSGDLQRANYALWEAFGDHDLWRIFSILSKFDPMDVVMEKHTHREAWINCGGVFYKSRNFRAALEVFERLYDLLCGYQLSSNTYVRKYDVLDWLAEIHKFLQHPALSNRCAILSLVDESMSNAELDASEFRIYEDLIFDHGFRQEEVENLVDVIYKGDRSDFPEIILNDLNEFRWMKALPSTNEMAYYRANLHVIKVLFNQLGDGTGNALEKLAQYLFTVIPGCRAYRRTQTKQTDFDVWCHLDGVSPDFRKEIGHYVLCECKDWGKPVGFGEIAKFARILDSANCKLGVMFAKNGISGDSLRDAQLEQHKFYHKSGIVIAVVNKDDLERILQGESFLTLLREKYEEIRFTLSESAALSSLGKKA